MPALSLLVLEEARVWVVASSSSEADFSSSDILVFSSGTPAMQKIEIGKVAGGVGVVLLTVWVKNEWDLVSADRRQTILTDLAARFVFQRNNCRVAASSREKLLEKVQDWKVKYVHCSHNKNLLLCRLVWVRIKSPFGQN